MLKYEPLVLIALLLVLLSPFLVTGIQVAGSTPRGPLEQPTQTGSMVINEILYLPGNAAASVPGYDIPWVELLNISSDPINVGGWTLSNRDGLTLTVLPDWEVPAGCYLTIHFGPGFDDADMSDCDGHFWTEPAYAHVFLPLTAKNLDSSLAGADTTPPGPSPQEQPDIRLQSFDPSEDECALYNGLPAATTITDFVAWSADGDYGPGPAHDYAVAAGIWTDGDSIDSSSVDTVDTIGRTFNGYDSDQAQDWWAISWLDFVRPGISQPANPIQYLPEKYIVLTDTSPLFDWADVPWVDGYRLQVDDERDFASPLVDVSGLTTSAYTPTSPLTTNLYFYRIAGEVGGEETRWSAAWLFVVDAGGFQTIEAHLDSCPFYWQRKDTDLLCLYNMAGHDNGNYSRPGCPDESGDSRWDGPHPEANPRLPHNRMNCCPASIAMLNSQYGGDLNQDRISYQTFNGYLNGPEGDLGHDLGYLDGEIEDTLSWALNGAAINQRRNTPFSFAQMKQWIRNLDCFVATIPGHCLVPDGYAELSWGNKHIQILYINDPWNGRSTRKVYTWQNIGRPQPDGLGADFTAVFLQPTTGVTSRMQEASVTTDSDGDGVMDFDETERFFTDPNEQDTEQDEVPDKEDIRSYTFYDTYCGGNNDALGFPDIDGDNLRAELDCDSDNGGDFDGGEDIDGDGHDCEANETDPFDPDDDVIGIVTNKVVYNIGEDVFIAGASFHANSSYPYQVDLGCPDLVLSDTIGLTGWVASDDTGTIPQWTHVWTCPSPGEYYVIVDVLKDGHYAEPDNWDPYTCFECRETYVPVIPPPDKIDLPDPVYPGERLTYTITISNTGEGMATGVTLIETYPIDVSFGGATPPPDQGNNVWRLGDLAPDSSTEVSIWVNVSDVPSGTVLINWITVTSTETVPVTSTEETLVIWETLPPLLDLSKLDNPDPVYPLYPLTYTITISNTGEGTATGVTLIETYPINVSFGDATPPPDQGNNVWRLGDLAPGSSTEVVIWVNVSDVPSGTVLLNWITVTSTETVPVTSTEETLVIWETLPPLLDLIKLDSPDPVYPLYPLTYSIVISNIGDVVVNNVVLTETYPNQAMFDGAEPPPDQGDNVWYLPDLAPGMSTEVVIWMRVLTAPSGTLLINLVTADGLGTEPVMRTEETRVIDPPPLPILELAKVDDPDPVYAGDMLTYTISLINVGDAEATDVTIVETYPDEFTFYMAEPWPDIGNHTWNLGSMPAGDMRNIMIWGTVDASVPAGTVLTNTVTADSAETIPIEIVEMTLVGEKDVGIWEIGPNRLKPI